MKRLNLARFLTSWLVACTTLATAQDYPNRPISMVVPAPPGGGSDVVARLMSDAASKVLRQTIVIENKAGANGILGAGYVARAKPDGYTLLFTYSGALVTNPALMTKLPYELSNFTPIVQISRGGNLLVVNPKLPVKTLPELIAYIKARPNQLNYCSWGTGSGGHLTMESLNKQANTEIQHVPFKGTADCVLALMSGEVPIGWADVASTMEQIRSGKLRAIAYSGATRLPQLPEVSTMTEAGYPFTMYSWYGIFAPATTPPEIVARLNATFVELQKNPQIVKRLGDLNLPDLPPTTPEQFADTVREDAAKWTQLIRGLNIKLN